MDFINSVLYQFKFTRCDLGQEEGEEGEIVRKVGTKSLGEVLNEQTETTLVILKEILHF